MAEHVLSLTTVTALVRDGDLTYRWAFQGCDDVMKDRGRDGWWVETRLEFSVAASRGRKDRAGPEEGRSSTEFESIEDEFANVRYYVVKFIRDETPRYAMPRFKIVPISLYTHEKTSSPVHGQYTQDLSRPFH
jgi:hypothetical protein